MELFHCTAEAKKLTRLFFRGSLPPNLLRWCRIQDEPLYGEPASEEHAEQAHDDEPDLEPAIGEPIPVAAL
jgi:hypothetical protein